MSNKEVRDSAGPEDNHAVRKLANKAYLVGVSCKKKLEQRSKAAIQTNERRRGAKRFQVMSNISRTLEEAYEIHLYQELILENKKHKIQPRPSQGFAKPVQ